MISGKIISPVTRQGANKNVNPKSSDLIDLTDEEDKTRSKIIYCSFKNSFN